MSQRLLREYFALCADGACLDLLSESEKRKAVEENITFLVGIIQAADTLNGNQREDSFTVNP